MLAEPLLTTVDSSMVGHLGTASLAGLSLASTILTTVVGIFIFLAYSTTALTSRAIGANDPARGIQAGIDAMWLAATLGIICAIALGGGASWVVSWFNASPDVTPHAITYLRYSSPGLVGMFIVLATTGTLRGLLDTTTPLWVAGGGAVLNAILNAALIYGAQLGIAGSAAGTAISQTLMALILVTVIIRRTRGLDVHLVPRVGDVVRSLTVGAPLVVRTLTLRAAFLATVACVTHIGTTALAAHQAILTTWMFAAFALDALGVSAQAIIGQSLSRDSEEITRALVSRIVRWGVISGIVIGAILVAASPWLPWIFGTDPAMRRLAMWGIIVVGVLEVISGYVFMLDGILIGAGDNRYLAVAGVITLVPLIPLLLIIGWWTPSGLSPADQLTPLLATWVALAGVFMAARAATTTWRVRRNSWMHLDQ